MKTRSWMNSVSEEWEPRFEFSTSLLVPSICWYLVVAGLSGACPSVHGHHTAAPQPLSIQRPAVARDPPPLRTPSPAAALPSASGPISPGPVFPSPAENQNPPGAAESLSGKAGSLKCGISMKTSSLSFLISWESCLLTSADRSSNG